MSRWSSSYSPSRPALVGPVALVLAVALAAVGCKKDPGPPASPPPAPVVDDGRNDGTDEPPASTEPAAQSPRSAVPEDWKYDLSKPPATSDKGMVVTDATDATRVGAAVLAKGGNAVDAAVATAFALAVVFPAAGNLGGGGFLVYQGADGERAALDFREAAPAGASRDMYLDPKTGEPTRASIDGHLASGVPGSVAGLWAAHQKYGTVPWKDLVAPAIALARDGFVVDAALAESLASPRRERMKKYPATARLLFPGDKPWAEGQTVKIPELAETLERIADKGPDGFYKGKTARLIAAEMKRGKGLITAKDLANYEAKWRAPVVFEYRGHQVVSMPPPSSGGLVLGLMANIVEQDDLAALGWHSAPWVHLVAEAMRRAYALRNAYLGDPDFIDIPTDKFLAEEQAASYRKLIKLDRATRSEEIDIGVGSDREGTHTTHFSVVDGAGNAVALTTTLNTSYGSGVTVTGAGFLLNNEMDDFAAAPGKPNAYGLVQGEANAIAPGKRMLSSMTPTVVSDSDGKVVLVAGAAGGPTITTATFQIMLAVIDHGMNAVEAIGAPRIHNQHLPDRMLYEDGGFAAPVVERLKELGHNMTPAPWPMADAAVIVRDGDTWQGGAEPREGGALAAGP